mmetsp:Transcript_1230/g.2185  ORF Transcript_1230/g.2185 Transcript_1230/m.2185 type:complete len:92 (-) Transcript_1230:204-479(-)
MLRLSLKKSHTQTNDLIQYKIPCQQEMNQSWHIITKAAMPTMELAPLLTMHMAIQRHGILEQLLLTTNRTWVETSNTTHIQGRPNIIINDS